MPELQDKTLIEWNLHAAEDMGAHDMIIGRDTLSFLKIDIKFSEQMVCWDESKMLFKPHDAAPETHCHMEEAMVASDATKQIKDILDAKCEAAGPPEKVCSAQSHLVLQQCTRGGLSNSRKGHSPRGHASSL